MLKKISKKCVKLVENFLPDPFLFAVILTLIVFVLGIFTTNQTPMNMINHWSGGFWNLLAFAMQMCLILVTGHVLANTPIVKKGLVKIAKLAKTPLQGIVLVTFCATIACWINWGFGLVIGALLARQIAKEVSSIDYRLLIASAYSGFLIWHAGLSGSIPLKLATAGPGLAKATNGSIVNPIPTSQTIFSNFNLIIVLFILFTLPFVNRAMHPDKGSIVTIDPKLLEEDEEDEIIHHGNTFADKMENSPILSMVIGLMGFSYIVYYFMNFGMKLNLNIVNFTFLFLGIILHKTPRRFLDAVHNSIKGTAGIVLQFPFYAGIMGMMVGTNGVGVSLAGVISHGFVNISTQTTFPVFTFLSAGIVNFFVPSGGGQWAVQAPIMMPAGAELGVNAAKTGMAIAWGDAWTNMIQPFWALPALGIANLGARDIMGFCLVDLFYSGIVIAIGLVLL